LCLSRTFWASLVCIAMFLCAMLCTLPGDGDGINIFNKDLPFASLIVRLAVMIPTGLFVVGAFSVGIVRYNTTFQTYRESKQAKQGVSTASWEEYKIEQEKRFKREFSRQGLRQKPVDYCTFGWFVACIVCAIVLLAVGMENDMYHVMSPLFSATLGVLFTFGLIGSVIMWTFKIHDPSPKRTKTPSNEENQCSVCGDIGSIYDKWILAGRSEDCVAGEDKYICETCFAKQKPSLGEFGQQTDLYDALPRTGTDMTQASKTASQETYHRIPRTDTEMTQAGQASKQDASSPLTRRLIANETRAERVLRRLNELSQ